MGDTEAKAAETPWYQSTLLWGCIGAFLAIVLTVVAAMVKDIRWLLLLAWPFAIFAAWEFARTWSSRKIVVWSVSGITTLVIGASLGWLYLALAPAREERTAEKPTSPIAQPTPTPAKPQLVSSYKKMVFVCDKLKAEKTPSLKERKAELAKYIDLMEKVFGYSVKGGVAEDELTLSVSFNSTTGVHAQTYLIKRVGDKIFVSITNEADNVIGALFGLASLDPAEDFAKQMMEKVEQLVQVEPGKCKYV